jgi:hypothetical protein
MRSRLGETPSAAAAVAAEVGVAEIVGEDEDQVGHEISAAAFQVVARRVCQPPPRTRTFA